MADWLQFVAEQREEYEARKRTDEPRFPSLKNATMEIWRMRRAGAV
ncbi:MAG: hypothetical protein MRY74_04365 [Neomegalonema sp.]|nr:hypothetical protein [Neomegalonema sp.]